MGKDGIDMDTDLTDAWLEWYDTCLLDKCSPEHISQLCRASNESYRKALTKLPPNIIFIEQLAQSQDASDPDFRQTFHIMETYLIPVEQPARKNKKTAIFKRAGDTPGNVTGYLLRDFFKSLVLGKHKGFGKNIVHSYVDPSTSVTQEEDKSNENWHELCDQQEMADRFGNDDQRIPSRQLDDSTILQIAHAFWNNLSERERAALYSRNKNCCMSDPTLLARVGCEKSVFSALPLRLLKEYIEDAQKYGFGKEDVHDLVFIGLYDCYAEWEQTSELGKWFLENMIMPKKDGMKTKFKKDSE